MKNEEIIYAEEITENEEIAEIAVIIPNVYMYSNVTKEYIGCMPADKDPAESKKRGCFIPLIPANATLIQPPVVAENQIQVFKTKEEKVIKEIFDEEGNPQNEESTITVGYWEVLADYRKNYLKVDNNLNVSEITAIGEQENCIIVNKTLGVEIANNKNKFKIENNEIVKKSDTEFVAEQLSIVKTQKLAENTYKARQAVENGFVTFKDAQFETNAQTVGDLTATMLMLQAQHGDYYEWLSKDDKVVELTADDFVILSSLIAEYKNTVWNEKYIAFKNAIENAQNIEDLKNINIDYEAAENE